MQAVTMYAETGMSFDSSVVRSSVRRWAIGADVTDPLVRDRPLLVAGRAQPRTTPASPLQSTSISSPSAGSPPGNEHDMTHGTWNSRLTMPMCDRGVPLTHTTAASSW